MAIKIEQRVGIAAPIDDVYEVIADINAWPEWSPIHKVACADLHFGAPVHLEEYYEGLGTWETDGVIADWTPLSHVHITVPKPFYAGSLIRYFEFDALSEYGSSFSIGALFSGYLSEREGRAYREFIRAGFAAFGVALKVRAEAKFASNPHASSVLVPPVPKEDPLHKPRPKWLNTHFWGKKK